MEDAGRGVAEQERLRQAREEGVPRRQWGPNLSQPPWGPVREDNSARSVSSSARHSIPTAPCAGAGSQSGASSRARMRSSKPSRCSPAQASTIAS